MAFVLDSSVAVAWLVPDEHSPAVDALADRLGVEAALVPAVWPLEVGNALLSARRAQRLPERDFDKLVALVARLPVEIAAAARAEDIPGLLRVAAALKLSVYDATYIELARRHAIPLATLDLGLAKACRTAGVATLLP
jgi:predicted nucleic acid-binding protein